MIFNDKKLKGFSICIFGVKIEFLIWLK